MSSRRALDEAKKGSAEIVILAVIEHESHHGYEIARLIADRTDGRLAGSRAAGSRRPGSAAAVTTASPNRGAASSPISAMTGAVS